MSIHLRWRVFAALALGTILLGLYTAWKTWIYFDTTSNSTGVAVFAGTSLCLLLVAALHGYMATGFKLGRLDLVTGAPDVATLWRGDVKLMLAAKIQFVRKLDVDNLSLAPDERCVFFICAYRPWMCTEPQFQIG